VFCEGGPSTIMASENPMQTGGSEATNQIWGASHWSIIQKTARKPPVKRWPLFREPWDCGKRG